MMKILVCVDADHTEFFESEKIVCLVDTMDGRLYVKNEENEVIATFNEWKYYRSMVP